MNNFERVVDNQVLHPNKAKKENNPTTGFIIINHQQTEKTNKKRMIQVSLPPKSN